MLVILSQTINLRRFKTKIEKSRKLKKKNDKKSNIFRFLKILKIFDNLIAQSI
jgi:hypothetical protein